MTILFHSLEETSPYLAHWEHVLNIHDKAVLDVDVWLIAQKEEAPLHFGNIYQREVLSRIKRFTEERFKAEVDFFINGKDTHLNDKVRR